MGDPNYPNYNKNTLIEKFHIFIKNINSRIDRSYKHPDMAGSSLIYI